VKLLQGGGNVALVAAAWFLWRSVQSLTRIEVFMATLFEVLLRSEGLKIRETDREKLRVMQQQMRDNPNGGKQRGFVTMRFLRLLVTGVILTFAGYSGYASAQPIPGCPTNPNAATSALLCWTPPTENADGTPIPATGQNALKEFRAQRSLNCTYTNFGTVLETLTFIVGINQALFTPLGNGIHCFRMRAVNNAGQQSVQSMTVTKTLPLVLPKTPKPGTGLTVN